MNVFEIMLGLFFLFFLLKENNLVADRNASLYKFDQGENKTYI